MLQFGDENHVQSSRNCQTRWIWVSTAGTFWSKMASDSKHFTDTWLCTVLLLFVLAFHTWDPKSESSTVGSESPTLPPPTSFPWSFLCPAAVTVLPDEWTRKRSKSECIHKDYIHPFTCCTWKHQHNEENGLHLTEPILGPLPHADPHPQRQWDTAGSM